LAGFPPFMHHHESRFEIAREARRIEERIAIAIVRKLRSYGGESFAAL
jgi:hypothetical protein